MAVRSCLPNRKWSHVLFLSPALLAEQNWFLLDSGCFSETWDEKRGTLMSVACPQVAHLCFHKDMIQPLTSGVASENLHTVSIPPSFQWPSSLTNTDEMQTLLWLDLPWRVENRSQINAHSFLSLILRKLLLDVHLTATPHASCCSPSHAER